MSTSLTIENINENTLARLRFQADRHGRSIQEEIRQILQDAVEASLPPGDLALSLFGPEHGVDLELPERQPHQPPDLDE